VGDCHIYATLPAQSTHKRRSDLEQNLTVSRGRISSKSEHPSPEGAELQLAQDGAEGGILGRLVI
jgi:hypothetical protein